MAGAFAGKVAVVTGASKGIGAAIARELGAQGASVVVNYSASKSAADAVVAAIERAGGKALAVQANLADEAGIVHLFDETKKAFGRVDVLINNAGVYDFFPLADVTADNFHKQFNLNVLGLVLATREAVKLMGPGGSIVNISSVVARLALPGSTVYAATKAAVDSITRTLAAELGPRGIRVNAVNPGMVLTEGAADLAEGEFRATIEAATPLGRIGRVGDVAPAVLFLASDAAAWTTGEMHYVSGGYR